MGLFGSAKESTVAELMAKKQYGKAVELLREQMKARPHERPLRRQLADLLELAGRPREAVEVLVRLADELAAEAEIAKAAAILKRIQRLDPTRSGIEEQISSLARERDRQLQADAPPAASEELELGIDLEEIELPDEPPPAPEPEPMPVAPVAGASAPAPPKQRRRGLAATPLFGDFSEDELVAVLRGLTLQTYEPGDVVVAEGQPGHSLFLIASGLTKAFVREAGGNVRRLREMKEGEFFGEISLIAGSPRTAKVTAATPCEILELDRATVDRISASHPHAKEVLIRFARERIEAGVSG